MNVKIFATTKGNGNTDLKKAFEKAGHNCEILNPLDLSLELSEGKKHDSIYRESSTKLNLKEVDAIITRCGKKLRHVSTLLHFIQEKYPEIYLSQSPTGLLKAQSKLDTARILRLGKVRAPAVFYSDQFDDFSVILDRIGLPCFVKTAVGGSQGNDVIKVDTEKELSLALRGYLHREKPKAVIVQKLIDIEPPVKDIRVLVFNGKVAASMERTAPEGSYLSNMSKGASGKEIELSDAERKMSIKACELLGLQVGAVDLMRDKSGDAYVIEVNTNYGVKINQVVDIDIHEELVNSINQRVKESKERSESRSNDFSKELHGHDPNFKIAAPFPRLLERVRQIDQDAFGGAVISALEHEFYRALSHLSAAEIEEYEQLISSTNKRSAFQRFLIDHKNPMTDEYR